MGFIAHPETHENTIRYPSQVASLKLYIIGFGRATCDLGRETVLIEQQNGTRTE